MTGSNNNKKTTDTTTCAIPQGIHSTPITQQTARVRCAVEGCEREKRSYWEGQPMCNLHWQRYYIHGQPDLPQKPNRTWNTCAIDGCDKRSRTIGGLYCEAHYARKHRTGTFDLRKPTERIIRDDGYVTLHCPEHPLRVGKRHPREYEHRVVFYDTHGIGPFDCKWCGTQVTWATMHVDHLNDVRDDNRIQNLVPSCATCNQHRTTSHILRLTHDGRTGTVAQWSAWTSIKQETLRYRLKRGWSIDDILKPPR